MLAVLVNLKLFIHYSQQWHYICHLMSYSLDILRFGIIKCYKNVFPKLLLEFCFILLLSYICYKRNNSHNKMLANIDNNYILFFQVCPRKPPTIMSAFCLYMICSFTMAFFGIYIWDFSFV